MFVIVCECVPACVSVYVLVCVCVIVHEFVCVIVYMSVHVYKSVSNCHNLSFTLVTTVRSNEVGYQDGISCLI